MNIDGIRQVAHDYAQRGAYATAELLRACADVVEAARHEELHTGGACETYNCATCDALARLEAIKP